MALLGQLLNWGDFGEAVSELARGFRDEHGLPQVHQLGLVVRDVEDAARSLEDRGVGAFFIADGPAALWREWGQERSFRGKMGLAYHQGFEFELLEPGEGSDFYRQALAPDGGIVIHHLGFLVSDVDEWAGKLAAAGSPVWVRGELEIGPMVASFAYVDTVDEAGLVIEFISWRTLGRPSRPPAGLFRLLGRLQKWSGKRSVTVPG